MYEGSSPLTRGKRNGRDGGSRRTGLIPAHAGKTRSRASWVWPIWAHPRSRGENPGYTPGRDIYHGSSPLTRGKLRPDTLRRRTVGLIPAHAGKTPRSRPRSWSPRAHPRSRGENGIPAAPPPTRTGSSPLTRGKRCSTRRTSPRVGLIPAHAGKTSRALSALGSLGAHPRSRGENLTPAGRLVIDGGSSPLTRGKPRPKRPTRTW